MSVKEGSNILVHLLAGVRALAEINAPGFLRHD
jgi:hypothetical protein